MNNNVFSKTLERESTVHRTITNCAKNRLKPEFPFSSPNQTITFSGLSLLVKQGERKDKTASREVQANKQTVEKGNYHSFPSP